MGPKNYFVHFKSVLECLLIHSWSSSQHLHAGKRRRVIPSLPSHLVIHFTLVKWFRFGWQVWWGEILALLLAIWLYSFEHNSCVQVVLFLHFSLGPAPRPGREVLMCLIVCLHVWTFRYFLVLYVQIGPLGTSGTFRYLLDLLVPLGPLGTYWTSRYLLNLYIHLGPLGNSWIRRYLLDLYVPLGPIGASWTFGYLLDLLVPLLGTCWTFSYLLDLSVPLGPLDTSWTIRYLLYLWVPVGPYGTSWTFRYLFNL